MFSLVFFSYSVGEEVAYCCLLQPLQLTADYIYTHTYIYNLYIYICMHAHTPSDIYVCMCISQYPLIPKGIQERTTLLVI